MIIIEHDPQLYEDAQGMAEYVSQGLHDATDEATVLLYAHGTDTFLEAPPRNADRIFYFDEGPRATTKLISNIAAQKSQITLEALDVIRWPRRHGSSILGNDSDTLGQIKSQGILADSF